MSEPVIELLVLDAHGVVLSDYLPTFLVEIARLTGEPIDRLHWRWRTELRESAWSGAFDDGELWRRLTRGNNAYDWRQVLEAGYQLGPAADRLSRWASRVPIWLLTNHRTCWLLPRLERFGLRDYFERVLVSDTIGFAKPDIRAFDLVRNHVGPPRAALFVDDHACNVDAARQVGIRAIQAIGPGDWVATVDSLLGAQNTRRPHKLLTRK